MIPFLIYALATIGLNLLTGYTGLLVARHRRLHGGRRLCLLQARIVVSAGPHPCLDRRLGLRRRPRSACLFGLPSLRIKGFYLAIATLAAQFFLQWCFVRIPWLYNYNTSGAIEVPTRTLFGVPVTGPTATPQVRYLIVLTIVVVMTWIASNIVRGRIGRMWMAVRDMDIAAELMGIRLLSTKLLAFAVSSFYCGVAGAMMVFLWYGGAEADVFSIDQSFFILFMVIIGGLGSLLGSYLGAALIFILPIILRYRAGRTRHAAAFGDSRTFDLHHHGRIDHFLPDRRAAWARAAMADRETETEGVALSLLMGHTRTNSFPSVLRLGETVRGSPFRGIDTQTARSVLLLAEKNGRTKMRIKAMILGAAIGAMAGIPAFVSTASAEDTIYVPLFSYRTGPFAGSGTPIANGMHDYLDMLNARDGGIGGAKIVIEECETGYDTKKGVECYESTKGKNPVVTNPYSTGITLQLIPKAAVDKIPVLSMAYGLSASADGTVFPWIFNPPATYWDGASVFIRTSAQTEGGFDKLKGKKIGLVHLDAPYGKEPIPLLQELAQAITASSSCSIRCRRGNAEPVLALAQRAP